MPIPHSSKMSRMCCYWLCCVSENRATQDSPGSSGGSAVDDEDVEGGGLSLATAASALVSLAIVAVAVSTGQWLLTEERMPKFPANRHSQHGNASDEPVKFTYSGLWKVCVAKGTNMEYECSTIDYFPKEEYSPDPSDSTMAIPYAVTKSAIFFLTATALLVTAEVCFFVGHFARPRPSLAVFAAGVIFIVSGLLMLVGMVMYISVFKAEVGSKLRPRSSFQGPPFVYRYGYSFLLYVSGFITTEFAGTSAIFLHISWSQLELIRESSKRKYTRGSYQLDHRHHPHQHHQAAVIPPLPSSLYGAGFHLCERHQKRYFYDPEPVHVGCHHHHHHHHHPHAHPQQLPPPPLPHHHNHFVDYDEYGLSTPTPGMLRHDLTTETVSTIADSLQDDYSLQGMQHEFVTMDLGENVPPLPEAVRNSSGWRSNSFKKTTPV